MIINKAMQGKLSKVTHVLCRERVANAYSCSICNVLMTVMKRDLLNQVKEIKYLKNFCRSIMTKMQIALAMIAICQHVVVVVVKYLTLIMIIFLRWQLANNHMMDDSMRRWIKLINWMSRRRTKIYWIPIDESSLSS